MNSAGTPFGYGMTYSPPQYAATKLTPQQRDEIGFRRIDGETVPALAAEYGVSVRTIYNTCPPRERP